MEKNKKKCRKLQKVCRKGIKSALEVGEDCANDCCFFRPFLHEFYNVFNVANKLRTKR